MIFIDSNVLIDVLNPDDAWFAWSRKQLSDLSSRNDAVVDTIVVAELASNFATLGDLRHTLAGLDIEILPLPEDVAFLAGEAFRIYRREHRKRDAILADFLIGAHAVALGAQLLSRDAAIYRTYFPDLVLITPETHP